MVHVIINGFAGHDEVRAEERRQDGNQLPGESPPCYSSDLPLKELDDIVDHFRSHQLAVETKLLETLTTGDFFHMSRLSLTFYLSNEMKALGTSLDLMKVKERKYINSADIVCSQLSLLNTLLNWKKTLIYLNTQVRASDVFTAYKHSLSATHSSTSSFDPEVIGPYNFQSIFFNG